MGNLSFHGVSACDDSLQCLLKLLETCELWLLMYDPVVFTWSPAIQAVQEKVAGQLKGTVTTEAKTEPGKEWVRGWDDWKRDAQNS